MPERDPFEADLADALRRTGDTFTPDAADLVEGGARRGRTRRLRQRYTLAGGLAGVAALGAGIALLGSPGTAAPDVGTSSTLTTAEPSATPVPALTEVLKRLLPKGTFTSAADGPDGTNTAGVFDDGHGAAALSVSVGRGGADEAGCPDPVMRPYDHCSTELLADGSKVTLFQGYEYPDRREDTKLWYANLVTPDGSFVTVLEWNSPVEKGGEVTRPNPPLSPDQLTKLVAARDLRALADGAPVPATSPAAPPASAVNVGRTFVGLLPKRLTVVANSPEDGDQFAYAVVDDGKGRSYVQINVQPGMGDVKDDLFGSGSEELADGTLVAVHKGPGEKGGSGVVMWTVDTLRADGFRVVVSAFNAASQQTSATRTAPALSVGELRAIALSPKWRPQGGSSAGR
ncbi:hypothetical protein ABZX85_03595 [Streptomyces sp. NPDC004539]|uniref:hypothetical protein n=1 Tax=Streptomyces sp. NPDC004539 TaxID=3154280 RepID=UPI0033A334FE